MTVGPTTMLSVHADVGSGSRRPRTRPLHLLVLVTLLVVSFATDVGPGRAEPAGATTREIRYSIGTAGSVSSDLGHFAAVVKAALEHPDGWSLGGSLRFRRVSSGANVRVLLASPGAIGGLPGCSSSWSCHVSGTVYVNETRWRHATSSWTLGLASYQTYVVNHEVGHYLGLGHASCPGSGAQAPVMMQQSKYIAGCRNNLWPLPSERQRVANRYGVSVVPSTPISQKYYALGGPSGYLGAVTQTERAAAGGGRYAVYQGGRIYWSPASGARAIHGSILDLWLAANGPSGTYRYPVSDVSSAANGIRFSRFQGGAIYRMPGDGSTYGVPEPLYAVYQSVGGISSDSALGLPRSGLIRTADQRAVYIDFQHGRIYRRSDVVAALWGPIFARHEHLGGVAGSMGHAVSGIGTLADGRGRAAIFERGVIYHTATTGARGLWGDLFDAYLAFGGPSAAGYPTTDRTAVGDGRGTMFEAERAHGYATPTTGARIVPEPILAAYRAAGGPGGEYGYPTGDVVYSAGRTRATQSFEGGTISLTSPYVAFVEAAYQDFLGRQPTHTQLEARVGALERGSATRASLVRELAASNEYVSRLVQRFYRDTLGREGGSSEVVYWVEQLRTRRLSVARVAALFYASPEYYDGIGGGSDGSWVTDLYAKVLGGTASDGDVDYWVGQIGSRGRTAVALHFYQGQESQGVRVRRLYGDLLGRAPSPDDVTYWGPRVASEGDLALATTLASLGEYFARSQHRYPS